MITRHNFFFFTTSDTFLLLPILDCCVHVPRGRPADRDQGDRTHQDRRGAHQLLQGRGDTT